MEVATKATAANNHSHHFLQAQQRRMPHHNSQNSLSVGLISEPTSGNGIGNGVGAGSHSPFQREVREWQRVDPDTGALLSGRLEADRWINGPMNSYGKISDSQNISQPNGTQHTQRKQLEVLQARTAHGAMQVIRAQTVQKTSSRWSSSTTTTTTASSSSASSTTASPHAMATSPTNALGALTNGHKNGTHSHHSNKNNKSFHQSSNFKNGHFQSPSFDRLDLLMASPPPLIPTLEITEVSNDHSSQCNGSECSSASSSHSSQSGSELEDNNVNGDDKNYQRHHRTRHHRQLVNGHQQRDDNEATTTAAVAIADIADSNDLFNRHSFLNKSHNDIGNRNLSLLMETLETAPSLKLSNLMKSNSSISSNNSSSNNSTTTTSSIMNSNTHQRVNSAAGKINLHAIVGGGGIGGEELTKRTSATTAAAAAASSSSSQSTVLSTTKTASWQQQQHQATKYGKGSVSLSPSPTKSRVGVNTDETFVDERNDDVVAAGGGGGGGGNVTPTQSQQQQRTQLKSRQQPQKQRDLESFRHYNKHGSKSAASRIANVAVACNDHNDDNDDDAQLRLSSRQQLPTIVPIQQRSRSISIDDLSSAERQIKSCSFNDTDEDEEDFLETPGEWKRVSKLRRSFQSSSNSSKSDISIQNKKPIDLPSNSTVSVAKIRAELENGRRLSTAMRNNHVDLAALDSLLNSTAATNDSAAKPTPSKRNSFLTAESLKEIRAGLKKLDDESLYRDDYIAATQQQEQAAPDEHIEIQQVKKPPERIRLPSPKSAFQIFTRQTPTTATAASNNYVITAPKHTTHSLETRQKHRDSAASIDWHLRRKSYGFEKMSPADDKKTMSRMDASTDSGLGRSGEQLGSWSPTNAAQNNTTPHATVIKFGGSQAVVAEQSTATSNIKPAIQRRYRPLKSAFLENEQEAELKRHSIAVDESQYMRKTTQVRLNGSYDDEDATPKSMQNYESSNANARKRVEFCKTEVHFAAESGRVNIVETDGKPPPTNNFRRRRRTTSGPLQTLLKSAGTASNNDEANTAKPITLFGDSGEHKILAQTTVAFRASLIEAKTTNDAIVDGSSVTFSIPKAISLDESSPRSSYASTTTSGIDTNTDCETDEISAIRGILKNKPIKPKPYHLGENIDSADALWGVQLRPINGGGATSTVAERVRLAEQRQDDVTVPQSSNFSTKIQLSLGSDENDAVAAIPAELPKSNVMSIELHSPQRSLERQVATKLKDDTTPIAKPRTVANVKNLATTPAVANTESNKDFLKIVKETRGARKLREHELSYFGVPPTSTKETPTNNTQKSTQISKSSKRSLPQRKIYKDDEVYTQTELISDLAKQQHQQQLTSKWQLLNDKPDLLQHSPAVVEAQMVTRTAAIKPLERKSLRPKSPLDSDDEHIYENIAMDIKPVFKVRSPVSMLSASYGENSYDRKTDLKRDAMILNEMTKSADQTMKAISDEAAVKDQRRRSSSQQRRHATPLETINEKINAERINEKCIAVQVTRNQISTDPNSRPARHGTPTRTTVSSRARSLSQSSNESCPRARSRSLSSERGAGGDAEMHKMRAKRSSKSATRSRTAATVAPTTRSSSRESSAHGRSCCSSGDEREKRTKRIAARSSRSRQTHSNPLKSSSESRKDNKDSHHTHHHHRLHREAVGDIDDAHRSSKQRISSSTAHSSRRERVECNDEATTKTQPHSHHRSSTNKSNSLSHRPKHKDDQHKIISSSSQRASSSDKRERDRLRASDTHHHHHHRHNYLQPNDSTHQRSTHSRTERDKERSKSTSRSKGHSSRSTQQQQQQPKNEHSTTKTRDLKKSSQLKENSNDNDNNKNHESIKSSSTHGKNTSLINGQIQHQALHNGQQQHHHNHHSEQQHEHVHKLTTATIAAKQREHRSLKDRK